MRPGDAIKIAQGRRALWVHDDQVLRCTGALEDQVYWYQTPIRSMNLGHLINSLNWLERHATELRASPHPGEHGACVCGVGLTDVEWVRRLGIYGALENEVQMRLLLGAEDALGRAATPPKKKVPPSDLWRDQEMLICKTKIVQQPPHQYGPGKIHYIATKPGDEGLRIACTGRFVSRSNLLPFDHEGITCKSCGQFIVAMRVGDRPHAVWEGDCPHGGED